MRDTARQPSNGFHLLGLLELFFQPFALGIVGDDFNKPCYRALGIAQWSPPKADIDCVTVAASPPLLCALPSAAAVQVVFQALDERRHLFRHNDRQWHPNRLFLAVSEYILGAGVP